LESPRRWNVVEPPAGRLVAARCAPQEHMLMLELEHVVVAVKAAEHLANPIHHSTAKPFRYLNLRLRSGHSLPLS
jgi:hypothetical protein